MKQCKNCKYLVRYYLFTPVCHTQVEVYTCPVCYRPDTKIDPEQEGCLFWEEGCELLVG